MSRVPIFLVGSVSLFVSAGDAYPSAVRPDPFHLMRHAPISGRSQQVVATPAAPRPTAPALTDSGVTDDQEDDSVEGHTIRITSFSGINGAQSPSATSRLRPSTCGDSAFFLTNPMRC